MKASKIIKQYNQVHLEFIEKLEQHEQKQDVKIIKLILIKSKVQRLFGRIMDYLNKKKDEYCTEANEARSAAEKIRSKLI